jgi:hypothetical protein
MSSKQRKKARKSYAPVVHTPANPVTIRRVRAGDSDQRTLTVSSFCHARIPENGFVIREDAGSGIQGIPIYIRDSDLTRAKNLTNDEEIVVRPWESQ